MTSIFAHISPTERILGLSALVSGALLAGAHIFEALGFLPCDLCLDQREAHWAALSVALAGFAAGVILKARNAASAAVGAAALVYAVSAGLAFYHAGVEFKFWPGPATCSGGALADISAGLDLGGELEKGPSGPSCTDAAWRFTGISMAGYNLLASAGLFVLCFGASISAARQARQAGPSTSSNLPGNSRQPTQGK